jgi:hypothetical protein
VVQLDDPQLLRLRELSRAEATLLEDFRRSANRLRDQLHRFYPQMLQLCSAADHPWLWDLIDLAPTPAHAVLLSEEQVHQVLKAHRIRRVTAQEVLACLQAPALPVAPGAAEAAQAHCGFLLPCLRVLAEQLVKGVVGAAAGFGVSILLLSVVLIGFDPENLVVGVVAAAEGVAGLALGSVIGAAMVAMTLAFGSTALRAPMRFARVPLVIITSRESHYYV